MINNLVIRKITENDLENLAKLYCTVYSHVDVGEHWDYSSAHRLLTWWLQRQPDLCFLAEYNNIIVGGFFSGIKPWWDGNHLVDGEIFVDPQYQKKGIGSELSKIMYTQALKKYGAICFDAITFRDLKHPLSWYKKLGFREIKEWVLISGDLKKVLKKLEK